jgi:N-acyl-D-amino-acid deacylase
MIDWLITDAEIVDGTGEPSFTGDIAISGDRIVEVGRLKDLDAKRLIEADGRIACPGFIDMHSHSDVLFLNGSSLGHKIYQGVTTELIGQDGMSIAPLTERSREPLAEMIEPLSGRLKGEWRPWDMERSLETMTEKRVPINVATLAGHCNLRLAAMGYKMALPSQEELKGMEEMLALSLKQGALGLSLGLIYPPSSYSDSEELIFLGKVVRDHDAILVVHMRDEQDRILEALEEMITVGRESGCRIHLSHLKCLGKKNWGRMTQVLGLLEQAHKEGLALSFDQYPYTASCTSLSLLLPGWALEGGWKGFRQRVEQPETLGKILLEMGLTIGNRGGPASIIIASVHHPKNQRFVGKTLERISEEKKVGSERAALEMLIEEQLQIIAIYHSLSERDVEQAMTHFLQTVGSDGILGEFPHPRVYGTFPRVIHHFSRERELFSLEEAIRKMTSAPASRLNLKDRGLITRSYYADILLFSPEKFRDTATFDDPRRFATGLDWAFVNGVPVVEEGKLQERFPGCVIRRQE